VLLGALDRDIHILCAERRHGPAQAAIKPTRPFTASVSASRDQRPSSAGTVEDGTASVVSPTDGAGTRVDDDRVDDELGDAPGVYQPVR
jgi:hypothetical protein